jgi:16S rRNA (guanine527-N7)-methyltransferase
LEPSGTALERLAKLAVLIEAWARRMNLTAHRTAEAVARRLILDSAALALSLPKNVETVVDIGSGAGFPGIPIGILHPDRRILLVESRERRHHFQRMVIRELALANVEARHGRAESLDPTSHDLGIAQAAGAPRETASLLLPWVRVGGWLALPGGKKAPNVGKQVGVVEERIVHYLVPLGGPTRSLWLARKADECRMDGDLGDVIPSG